MIFRTQSGSRYEINYENKQIRRLAGAVGSTTRQGKDGNWKSYSSITVVVVGLGVAIVWGDDVPLLPGSPEGAIKTTLTSDVIAIES